MKTQVLTMACAAALTLIAPRVDACTRAVYLGPDGMTATGRTMDWKEDPESNLYIFARGVARRGGKTDNTVFWTSKYGSVSAAAYDIGICDGINEMGLAANLLFLTESVYDRPNDKRPVMGLSIWTQYVLDNFATVNEAVTELQKQTFCINAPDLPNGIKSRLHMAISDPTGDSAILEYIDGELTIHHGKQYQVLTNSPVYDQQLAINWYWQQIGGVTMLPGTNRSSDRFVRASFYINAAEQSSDATIAIPTVVSVMRNVSVPFGISTPDMPHIASTRWRVVADQKDKVYYFDPTLALEGFWVDLKKINFAPGSGQRELMLTGGGGYTGDATGEFRKSAKPFDFLFGM